MLTISHILCPESGIWSIPFSSASTSINSTCIKYCLNNWNTIYFRADGACRDVAAALYEFEAFERKSCTDGENQWKKRPRHDVPVPIRHLTVIKAKYASCAGYGAIKPHIDVFDPRLEHQRQGTTEDEKRDFALKLQEVKFVY